MDVRRKPSVLITTYPVSSGRNLQECNGATNSELVTDLFNKRNKRNQSSNRIQLDLSQIKGPTGTIRGHKDVVKKSLENIQIVSRWSKVLPTFDLSPTSLTSFLSQASSVGNQTNSLNSNQISLDDSYREDYINRLIDDEIGQCVAYTTTLGIIRRTFEDSRQMRSILNLNLIRYEERDIYLNQEYKLQLKLRCKSMIVPALFIDGQFLGGIKELEKLNENGLLKSKLSKFKMLEMSKFTCQCCGNARFIACQSCNGSRRSAIHHFKFNSVALRCIKCDKNDGLVQCPLCSNDGSSKKVSYVTVDLNNNNVESKYETEA